MGSTPTLIGILQGYTHDGQVLTWETSIPIDASAIVVETTASPSWVAWSDIRFHTY